MASGNKFSKTAVWILMGMLILGLGGFGVTNLSGTVRSVGTVGDTDIGVTEYARALQNEIRAFEAQTGERLSFAQVQAAGIDDLVLSRLVATTALEDETARLGISIGDANLRTEIIAIPGFQGVNGEFDRESYRFALEQAGLTEAQFETDVRAETSRTLVQGAIVSGVSAPEPYLATLMTYLGERRDITWAILERGDLTTGLPVADDAALTTYHQSHLPDFTTPETKSITYVWLTPSMIIDTVEVDEATLREAYKDREDEFNQPERRLVERLIYNDQAGADAARAALDDGSSSFEDLVEARGLDLSDIDIGDVAPRDLGDASDAVFAAEAGEIVGPLPTDLGPALFRVNGILVAQVTSFENASAQLRDEIAGDRARRVIDGQMNGIDDLLAGGATLEELAAETEMQIATIDWHDAVSDDIGGYDAFRTAAQSLATSDFPELAQLEDGGIYAMRLDKVIEPRIQSVDEVRPALTAAWRAEALVTALRAQAEPQLAQLTSGSSFADLGYTNTQSALALTRSGFQADAPPEFIEAVFGMTLGEARILDGNGRIFVLHLDAINAPDNADEDITTLRQTLADQAANAMAQDLFQALANDIRTRAGIELDQQALNAVHTNFQ